MAGESPPRRLSQIFDPLMSLSELQAQIQQQQHQLAHLKYSSGGGGGGGGGGSGSPTPPLPPHPPPCGGMGIPPIASSSSTQTFSSSSTLQHHHHGGPPAGGGPNGGGGGYYNTTASSSTSLSSVSNQSSAKLSSSSSTGSYIGGTLGSGGSGSGGGGVPLPVPPPHLLGRIMMGSRSTPNSPRLMSRRNGSGAKPPPVPQKPSAAYIANPSLVALDCDAPWPPLGNLGPDALSLVEGHHHLGGGGSGYMHHQPEINWQERCLELQLELHRSRNQAGRVRDMLREKDIMALRVSCGEGQQRNRRRRVSEVEYSRQQTLCSERFSYVDSPMIVGGGPGCECERLADGQRRKIAMKLLKAKQ
uniref:Uncharacterized protein n=1 Tax=Anopheles farauti TaxID=69004 RepID=A0A182QI07_9DIPT